MVYDVIFSCYLVNNRTEEKMMTLLTQDMSYNDKTFWNYAEDDLHDCFKEHRNTILRFFKTDAPISVRIEFKINDSVLTTDKHGKLKKPALIWDIPLNILLTDKLFDLDAAITLFKEYVAEFVYAAGACSIHYVAFTEDLPGSVFDRETRETLIERNYHKNMVQPHIDLRVWFEEQESSTLIKLPLYFMKGEHRYFDKKETKANLIDHLNVHFKTMKLKPRRAEATIYTYSAPTYHKIYEMSVDGMASILVEHVKDTIRPNYEPFEE